MPFHTLYYKHFLCSYEWHSGTRMSVSSYSLLANMPMKYILPLYFWLFGSIKKLAEILIFSKNTFFAALSKKQIELQSWSTSTSRKYCYKKALDCLICQDAQCSIILNSLTHPCSFVSTAFHSVSQNCCFHSRTNTLQYNSNCLSFHSWMILFSETWSICTGLVVQ